MTAAVRCHLCCKKGWKGLCGRMAEKQAAPGEVTQEREVHGHLLTKNAVSQLNREVAGESYRTGG